MSENAVSFESITYKNFNTIGNHPITIHLNKHKQTLITGKNGSGKSTLLGCIVYVLFGKAYNGVPIGSLINTTNKKKLIVEITFKAKGNLYTVIRGQKPNIFEIYENEVFIESEAAKKDYQQYLESVLGFDHNTFTHTIGLSKEKYKPFFDLPEGEKRVLIEELLGLTLFSSMNDIVKKQIKEQERIQTNNQHQADILSTKLSGLENVVEREKMNNNDEVKLLSKGVIDKTERLNHQYENLSIIEADVKNLILDSEANKDIKTNVNEIKSDVKTLHNEIQNLINKVKFYTENSVCPTCKQTIDGHNSEIKAILDDYNDQKTSKEFTIEKLSKKAISLLKEIDETIDVVLEDNKNILHEANSEISLLENEIKNLKTRIKNLIVEAETSESVNKDLEAIKDMKDKIKQNSLEQDKIVEKIHRLKKYHGLLKDQGVKSKVISSYIPLINESFNKFLSSMGYAINIMVDSVFKEKVIMPGKESFKYRNFSSGQKTRINLALLLTLLVVARQRNAISTNLLFMDEALENVDIEGVIDLVKLFDVQFPEKNIFIVSQRKSEFEDIFNHNIHFELDDGFTILTA